MSPRPRKANAANDETDGVFTRQGLADKIAEAHPFLTQVQSYDIVQTAVEAMSAALASGKNISFRNFGVLQLVTRKPRPGRNPRNPSQVVSIPARTAVRFKTSPQLKAALNPKK